MILNGVTKLAEIDFVNIRCIDLLIQLEKTRVSSIRI